MKNTLFQSNFNYKNLKKNPFEIGQLSVLIKFENMNK